MKRYNRIEILTESVFNQISSDLKRQERRKANPDESSPVNFIYLERSHIDLENVTPAVSNVRKVWKV